MISNGTNAVATSTFLNELRLATAPSHQQLEELPVSVALTGPQLTTAAYTTYLQLMYSIVSDVEENVYPQLSFLFPEIVKRSKAHWIEKDFKQLNIEAPAKEYPLTKNNNKFTDAFALGIMYVIEGSTLGGRFILKNVEKNLGLSARHGSSYFAGYQADTGSNWKTFLDALSNYSNSNNKEEIINGAVFAFTSIHNYMSTAQG